MFARSNAGPCSPGRGSVAKVALVAVGLLVSGLLASCSEVSNAATRTTTRARVTSKSKKPITPTTRPTTKRVATTKTTTRVTTRVTTRAASPTLPTTVASLPATIAVDPATGASTVVSVPSAGVNSTRVVTVVPSSLVASARARAPFEQFGEVRFVITNAQGKDVEYCALLADTPENQQRGLMGRRDLGAYDAMLFTWPFDVSGGFWMRTVPIWLSIAWWDRSGRVVTQLDMAPCGDSADCPVYTPTGPYRVAMETLRGGLEPLGVSSASMLQVGGACRKT